MKRIWYNIDGTNKSIQTEKTGSNKKVKRKIKELRRVKRINIPYDTLM